MSLNNIIPVRHGAGQGDKHGINSLKKKNAAMIPDPECPSKGNIIMPTNKENAPISLTDDELSSFIESCEIMINEDQMRNILGKWWYQDPFTRTLDGLANDLMKAKNEFLKVIYKGDSSLVD
jgi:hypothetical protein